MPDPRQEEEGSQVPPQTPTGPRRSENNISTYSFVALRKEGERCDFVYILPGLAPELR